MAVNYPIYDVSRIKQIKAGKILVNWEEAKDTHLDGKLVRPDTYKGVHYTGYVIMKGEPVALFDDEIKIGDRILFDGFLNSQMVKFEDPSIGRVCMIDDHEAVAVIPDRETKIVETQGEYNFDM